MNYLLAKEVGILPYVCKRILWRIRAKSPRTNQLRLPSGASFAFPSGSMCAADVYVSGGIIDWGSEYVLIEYLRTCKDGTFVDVGANVGYYSSLVSPFVTSVMMFDPDPRNAPVLRMLTQTGPAFVYYQQAVSDMEGSASFTLVVESSVSSLGEQAHGAITVQCVTLDAVFGSRSNKVVAIKVDVEGHELAVLRGARALIRRDRPITLSEFNIEPGKPNSREGLLALAAELDLNLYAITRRDPSWHKCVFAMEALDAIALTDRWYKMIFLVPKENIAFAAVMDSMPRRWRSSIGRGRWRGWPTIGTPV